MSASPVSHRLQSSLSTEIQELISIPRLRREWGPGFSYMLKVNAAHLLMLESCGLMRREAAAAVAAALVAMAEEGPDAVVPNPSLEDAYFNMEARLIVLTGAEAGGLLHVGRSRNDLGATAERMRARDVLLDALGHGARLLQVLGERAALHADTVMTGYTHLQPAQPITFGYYLAGIGSAVLRDVERLREAWVRLNHSPLGAGALAGTGFAIDRGMTAELLGFDAVMVNGLDAVAVRDFASEMLAALLGAATTLSRMATDMYVASTAEFGLLDFPDSVAITSSIMPQKKNLAFLEHLRAKPAQVLAGLTSMTTAVKATSFSNTMDGNREAMRFAWDAMGEGVVALRLGKLAASQVEPQAGRMEADAAANFSCVTDLADALVERNGLSFRQAHHVVGAVVFEALRSGTKASGIDAGMVAKALETVAGRPLVLSAAEIADCLDPRRSVARRSLLGGPAPEQTRAMADALLADARRLSAWQSERRAGLDAREAEMMQRVQALAG